MNTAHTEKIGAAKNRLPNRPNAAENFGGNPLLDKSQLDVIEDDLPVKSGIRAKSITNYLIVSSALKHPGSGISDHNMLSRSCPVCSFLLFVTCSTKYGCPFRVLTTGGNPKVKEFYPEITRVPIRLLSDLT